MWLVVAAAVGTDVVPLTTQVNKDRFISKLFLRGDSVILGARASALWAPLQCRGSSACVSRRPRSSPLCAERNVCAISLCTLHCMLHGRRNLLFQPGRQIVLKEAHVSVAVLFAVLRNPA